MAQIINQFIVLVSFKNILFLPCNCQKKAYLGTRNPSNDAYFSFFIFVATMYAPNGLGSPNPAKQLAHQVDLLGRLLSRNHVFEIFKGHVNTRVFLISGHMNFKRATYNLNSSYYIWTFGAFLQHILEAFFYITNILLNFCICKLRCENIVQLNFLQFSGTKNTIIVRTFEICWASHVTYVSHLPSKFLTRDLCSKVYQIQYPKSLNLKYISNLSPTKF